MDDISLTRGECIPSQSFEEIYDRHFNTVYRLCFSYMKTTADTEDAAAEVFAKLLRKSKTFENAEHEKAWLLRTAINTCKDNLKYWWRKRESIDDYLNLQTEDRSRDGELLKTIMALPERYKDVIYLYYYEGYTTAEVAQILKKPQSTVRNHMSEARKLLKGVLEDEK